MNQNVSNSNFEKTETIPDINLSLSELESIVYDFVTYDPKKAKNEMENSFFKPRDVQREDLMKITKLDKKKVEEEPLPALIRDYILHDRGNSIFLGDSFANLPSPVGEGETIKKLFKFNDEDDEKKLEREREREKEKNEIKIEGKTEKKKEKNSAQPGKSNNLNMKQIEEIDKIVFDDTIVKQPVTKQKLPSKLQSKHTSITPAKDQEITKPDAFQQELAKQSDSIDPYSDLQTTKLQKEKLSDSIDNLGDQSGLYQEEDSYINPSNVSKVNNSYMSADLGSIEEQHNTIETTIVARSNPRNPYGDNKKEQKQKNKSALPAYDSINNSNILVDGEVSFAMDTNISDKLIIVDQSTLSDNQKKTCDASTKSVSLDSKSKMKQINTNKILN